MKKTTIGFILALGLATASGPLHADELPAQVQKALAGQILVTPRPFSELFLGGDEPLAALEKARLRELAPDEDGDVASWKFYFTAFLEKAPRVSMLSMDFYTDDKERRYVANKRFGVAPGLLVISGRIALTEDDGLARNRRYLVKLTGQVKGREVVFATTKLTTK